MSVECKNCRFWLRPEVTPMGECRRYAPIADTTDSPIIIATWPPTDPDDWCGDYETGEYKFIPRRDMA